MNYAGKFDAALSLDVPGLRAPSSDHVDSFTAKAHGHVPDGAIVIADPNLIFHGEFKRAGLDLVLSHDGHDVVVHDYFRGDKRAAIASPDGAHLTGDIVSALTGYVQVAQAAPGVAAAQVIGHVTKLTGSATAIRNGVSVILNNGDNVEKGDVVSTGSDSTLGITFIDGTVFGLSSGARMVLNEMVYDPNGSNNSSLLSLVAGTITFVAGETAKHGDMKIDTPVATMGIRGTAVLTEINFVVPPGGGDPQPQANFQVLVEPNGTTGSYILFDKLTLLPIATVNQAGQMIQISGGNVSVTNGLLSPEVQKLITDVFTLKFTDNNTNTKLTTNFTDTITQNGNIVVIKTDTGATATATFNNTGNNGSGPTQGGSDKGIDRFPGAPHATSLDANGNVTSSFTLKEQASATGDHSDATGDPVGPDTVIIRINFLDQNLGDRPTVSVDLADAPNYVYMDAGKHDVTGSLSALQKHDIAAAQIQINVAADAGNTNNGSATLTYTIPDHVFDFLGAGETLTLTYMVHVNDNFAVNPESNDFPITITITGTNDKPVITTGVPTITFSGGTSVSGGSLTTKVPTSGTLTFKDPDLTDTHSVSVSKFSAVLPGGTVPETIATFLSKALLVSIKSGHDSTGSGTGSIDWSLKDIPVYLADFIPKGEVLTLTYTVTVKDSQGATSDQTITVTITGTDAPAVVWIATNTASGGFWREGANWETGVAPTINDDVIVITDQLHGLTPSYPVTIDMAAYGKSLTMDDYDKTAGHKAPEIINHSTLTLAGKLTLNADAKFTNAADGTVFVGGAIDVETVTRTDGEVVVNTVTISNAGTLTLAAGGKIATLTTVTNSGLIELSGGTLALESSIANTGGTVQVDIGATLVADTVTLDGGTVAIFGTLELDGTSLIENGTLNNSGVINVKGAAEFANEAVANKAGGTIEVWANDALTIDQGSHVNNSGNVKVDAGGKLTVNGATIDGGAIPVYHGDSELEGGQSEGTDIGGLRSVGTVTNNGELDLTGNAVLSNGNLKNNGALNVSGTGNALNREIVTNTGTIAVLASAALTLNGATISGGAVMGSGSIDVTGASKIDSDATLSVATVTADAKLTLDGITVSGSVITDKASIELDNIVKLQDGAKIQGTSADAKGGVTNNGTLEIAGAATLLNDVVTNYGTVKVDGSQTLTLSSTEIDGGTLTIAGTLESTGISAIADADMTNTGTISVTSGVLTIDADALHTLINENLIEVIGGAELDISGGLTIANKGGTITVDGASKLDLSDVTINGGNLDNSGNLYAVSGLNTITATVANSGIIEVQAGTLDLAGGITGAGEVIVDKGATLEFSGATGSIHIVNSGSIVGGGSDAAIHIQQDTAGSVIDNDGTIGPALASSVTSATDTIVETGGSVTINNTGHINGNISVAAATFNNEAHGTWTVAGTSVFGALSTIDNAGEIDLHDGASISGADGMSFAITNSGTIESWGTTVITGAITTTDTSAIEVHSGTLTLYGSLSGSGSVTIDAGATLDVGATVSQTITFGGDGAELQIDTTSFSGAVAGFAATDKLDLSSIVYDAGTWATYDAETGDLVVNDAYGHSITVKLVGADYSDAHLAGSLSSDGHGGTLITYNAVDDKPAFVAAEATQSAVVAEQPGVTGSSTSDQSTPASGTIHFTDVDLTDRPTAKITDQTATWLDSDGHTQLTLTSEQASALENALTVLTSGKNNGAVDWSYSIKDSALDFLGQGQTATVVSTITLDDHHGGTDTAQVTVTITGANDAPVIDFSDTSGSHPLTLGTQFTGDQVYVKGVSTGDQILYVWNDLNANELKVQSFDSSGSPETSELSISASSPATASLFTAVLADGDVAVLAFPGEGRIVGADGQLKHSFSYDGAAGYTSIVPLSGGGFVVVDSGSGSTGAVLSAYDSAGNQLGTFNSSGSYAEFNVHEAVALSDGGFLFAWKNSAGALVAETFNADGTARDASPSQFDAGVGDIRWYDDLDLAKLPNGQILATWSQSDGTDHTIYGRLLDSSGHLISGSAGAAFEISQTSGNLYSPHVSVASNGQIVVAWYEGSYNVSWGMPSDAKIEYRVIDQSGNPVTDEHVLTVGTPAGRNLETVSLPDGSVVMAWAGYDSDGQGVHFAVVGSNGAILKSDTLVDVGHQDGDQIFDNLVVGADGSVYVTLTDRSPSLDGSGNGVTSVKIFDASMSAQANLVETNSGLTAHGSASVSDADATDHVTVSATSVAVKLDGHLQADGFDGLWASDVLNYLKVQSGDILDGTATHAKFTWDFNSGSQPFDFLAAGHTLSLQYTIVPNDGHTTGAGGVITINIAGSNDAPTLDDATLASVRGNNTDPAGTTISDLFAGKFHDVDDGASFKAIAVTSDAAGEGTWQYEVAGTSHWVDIGSVSDSHALVLGTDTLIRFVPADGFTGTPDPLGVHALDDTYTGGITTSGSPATTDITAMSTDGTAPVSDKAATISTSVTAPAGPVIDTDHFYVSHNGELGTDTIFNLSVTDTDSGASTDDFTVTAITAHAPGSSVDLSPASGLLDDINAAFENGITYSAGETPPDTDQITLTVTDKTTGAYDTVNFIFNEAGDTSQGITLTGTSGKDVIFATTTGDTLTGGGGKDQFVFSPGSSGDDATHTITDFIEGLDKIDLRQFSGVSSIRDLTITQDASGTHVAWQQQIGQSEGSVTEHESLLLKNVTATLKASDFIFHIT